MEGTELTLRWEKFGLSRGLHEMLASKDLVDVTIACQGEYMQAHKTVLAACSTQFRKIFLANPCQHPVIFMQDSKLSHLQAVLNFMYTGEATVLQHELAGFMKTAEALKVSGLTTPAQGPGPVLHQKKTDAAVSPPKKTRTSQAQPWVNLQGLKMETPGVYIVEPSQLQASVNMDNVDTELTETEQAVESVEVHEQEEEDQDDDNFAGGDDDEADPDWFDESAKEHDEGNTSQPSTSAGVSSRGVPEFLIQLESMLEAMEDDSPPPQKPSNEMCDTTELHDDIKELLKQPLRRLLPRKENSVLCGSILNESLDTGANSHQSENSPLSLKGSLKRLIPRKCNKAPKDCDTSDNVNLSGELDRSHSSTHLVKGTLKRLLPRNAKALQDIGGKKQCATVDNTLQLMDTSLEDNNQSETSEMSGINSSDSDFDSSEEKNTRNSASKTEGNTKKIKYDKCTMYTGPRKCDVCKKIFANEDSRRSHVRKYHSGRVYVPIPCQYCDKFFKFNSQLTVHLRNVHSPNFDALTQQDKLISN